MEIPTGLFLYGGDMAASVVYEHKIDPEKAQAAYELIIDSLMVGEVNRAEGVIGLITVLATQYNGGPMEPAEMRRFTEDITDWLSAYFSIGEKH